MDHEDDVEHLFSWLQTPDLRYREFAGAREITDSVIIVHQQRANNTPVPADAPVHPPRPRTRLRDRLEEEYPENQFPDQGETRIEVLPAHPPIVPPAVIVAPGDEATAVVREEERIVVREEQRTVIREEATVVARETVSVNTPPLTVATPGQARPFALGASGRDVSRRPQFEEPVAPPTVVERPAPRQTAPPPPVTPPLPSPPPQAAVPVPPESAPLPPPAHHAAAALPQEAPRLVPPAPPVPPPAPPPPGPTPAGTGGGLLGGAYREQDANGQVTGSAGADQSAGDRERHARSLDAVFGRLAGAQNRLPDPRQHLRHIPGVGSTTNRSR
ncbi:MAG TPA: hypothetical protein VM782_18030 [Stellaceae bacterium]|nr:hypothetical protein [Stellaceae bacterium]